MHVVVRRYARNMRLENALYHWARLATQHDALSRRRCAALRRRGHRHGRALRTVADRLLSANYREHWGTRLQMSRSSGIATET
jgi:hypothetical protein